MTKEGPKEIAFELIISGKLVLDWKHWEEGYYGRGKEGAGTGEGNCRIDTN